MLRLFFYGKRHVKEPSAPKTKVLRPAEKTTMHLGLEGKTVLVTGTPVSVIWIG